MRVRVRAGNVRGGHAGARGARGHSRQMGVDHHRRAHSDRRRRDPRRDPQEEARAAGSFYTTALLELFGIENLLPFPAQQNQLQISLREQ